MASLSGISRGPFLSLLPLPAHRNSPQRGIRCDGREYRMYRSKSFNVIPAGSHCVLYWAGFHGSWMENAKKKLLLIDADDARRDSRILLLTGSGYTVDLRDNYIEAERLDHEGTFDLVVIALHGHPERALAYSGHLSKFKLSPSDPSVDRDRRVRPAWHSCAQYRDRRSSSLDSGDCVNAGGQHLRSGVTDTGQIAVAGVSHHGVHTHNGSTASW